MILTIDLEADRPLYLQIADGVRGSVAKGSIQPGDRLPPGRQLAETLGVNLETVQRAYRLLASEGVVTSRVGRGTRISESVDVKASEIAPLIDQLAETAQRLGLDTADVMALVGRRMQQ